MLSFKGGLPRPSFQHSFLSGPSGGYLGQLVLRRGYPALLPAVLPSWSFQGEGVPCDLSHNALDVTCLLSRHQLMGLGWCSCLYTAAPVHHGKGHMGPPSWTDWLTDKHAWKHYLPALRVRAVKIHNIIEYENCSCNKMLKYSTWKQSHFSYKCMSSDMSVASSFCDPHVCKRL